MSSIVRTAAALGVVAAATLGAVSAHAAGPAARVHLGDSSSGLHVASATHLYYACELNICLATMNGSAVMSRSHVTQNGSASARYTSPSISRAGTRLAFIYGNTAYDADSSSNRDLHVNTALIALM